MPELPEVETVVQYLRPRLEGRTITGFEALWPKVCAPLDAETFARSVAGRLVRQVRRRGKFILWDLDEGHVHIHLRMTGRLLIAPEDTAADEQLETHPHITARFGLDDGSRVLFRDMRKFGRVGYLADLAPLEAKLGLEPLSKQFTQSRFYHLLRARRRQIKPLLLDQSFVAGLGNIYTDEALFQARIHPEMPAHRLSRKKAAALHRAIQTILGRSIDHQGTTFINFGYGRNRSGAFRERLMVFGRAGQACPICGGAIIKIRVGQRGTHLCRRCQHR